MIGTKTLDELASVPEVVMVPGASDATGAGNSPIAPRISIAVTSSGLTLRGGRLRRCPRSKKQMG